MTKPFDLRDFCSAVAWDERRRSDIKSHVGSAAQAAAGGLVHLAIRPGSNLDHRKSRSSALREVYISCRMGTYLLRRDCSIGAMFFASKRAEPDSFLRNSVRRERTWLDHCTHMGSFMYGVSPGLEPSTSSARTRSVIWNEFCTSLKDSVTLGSHAPPSHPSFPSLALLTKSISSERWRTAMTVSLRSIASVGVTNTG